MLKQVRRFKIYRIRTTVNKGFFKEKELKNKSKQKTPPPISQTDKYFQQRDVESREQDC